MASVSTPTTAATGPFDIFAEYVDSDAPGSRWAREARNGDAVRFFGPRGSLDLSSISSPILFGDETCFGLAAALRNTSGGKSVPCVFEVNDPKESANRARAVMAANSPFGSITIQDEERVEPQLESGELIRVLEDWCQPFPGFFLYYPSRRQQPAALAALINTLRL
jgi:DNA-binding transcriptional LysR family regulator